jgi:hypothetical protein
VQIKEDQEEGTGKCEPAREQGLVRGDQIRRLNSTDSIASREESREKSQRGQLAKTFYSPQFWILIHSYFTNIEAWFILIVS